MTLYKSGKARKPRQPSTPVTYLQNYPQPAALIEWLNEEVGRGAYLSKVDPELSQPRLSKLKAGVTPITLELALRIERAQKASAKPLKAIDLMTFAEDRMLYRYVTGQDPAPEQLKIVRKSRIMLKPTPQQATVTSN